MTKKPSMVDGAHAISKPGGSHMPELDGLRGVAVLMVLCDHLVQFPRNSQSMKVADHIFAMIADFGWFGVDLFFVLSGFLITGILLRARTSPRYFRNFYARRFFRIFPLYYAFLAIAFFALPHFSAISSELAATNSEHHIYFWTYIANFPIGLHKAGTGVTLLVWSLAIEEQFYLVWPFVIFVCARRRSLLVCSLLVPASLLFRIAALQYWDSAALYFWTPCRMDSLAVGSAIALLWSTPNAKDRLIGFVRRWWWLPASVLISLVTLAQSHHLDVRQSRFTSLFVYTASALTFGALLVITAAYRPKLFRWSAFRFLGRYSYFLYLFHEPVRFLLSRQLLQITNTKVFGLYVFSAVASGLIVLGCTVPLALASWIVFEKPILNLKRYFPEVHPDIQNTASVSSSSMETNVNSTSTEVANLART